MTRSLLVAGATDSVPFVAHTLDGRSLSTSAHTHTHTHTHGHGHGHGAQEAHSSLPSACQCLLWSSLGAAQPGLRPQGQSVSMHRASAQVYSSQCMRSVHSVCVRSPYLTQALTLLEWSRSTPGQDGMACQLCGHTQRHLSVAAVATTAPTPTPVPDTWALCLATGSCSRPLALIAC